MGKTFFLAVFALAAGVSLAIAQEHASPFQKFGCDYSREDSLSIVHADVPLYPALAVAAKLTGTVKVHVVVKAGEIVTAEPISGANPLLAASAKANVQTWRFGEHGYGEFCITYVYELDKVEVPIPRNPTVEMDFPSRVRITTSPVTPVEIP